MIANVSFASSRVRRVLAASAVGLVFATAAPAAFADPESDAKDLFARGRELRANNDCGTAAPLFRKAWTVYPSGLGSLRNLAECEEQLGHFASSRRAWLDLKRALITAPNDPKYEGWDKDSEDAAARLKPKVASFVVDVIVKSPQGEAPATDKTGVELFVNGEAVSGNLVGTPLERDPGTYVIRSQLKDAQPVEQSVALNAGDNPHVTLRMEVVPPAHPVGEPAADHSTRRTVGWAIAGVGAASLIASAITFGIRSSALSDVNSSCSNHQGCNPNLKDTVDRGKTMTTLTDILFPVGLVGVGAGLVLVFVSPKTEQPAASITISPTLGGGMLTGTF